MRKRSDAGGEASATTEDPKKVILLCDGCGTKMTLAALQKMEGKCWKCEHTVDVAKATKAATTPTPGGNPHLGSHPLEHEGAKLSDVPPTKAQTTAAIAAVRGDDASKPEPDPWQLRPESVDATKAAVPPVAGALPGVEARAPSISELVSRLNVFGYKVSVGEAAKWTPQQSEHALMVTSSMEKGLAPTVEEWLMASYEKPRSRRAAKTDVADEPSMTDAVASAAKKGYQGAALATGTLLSATDTVSVTWGEEKFTPVAYSTVTVGPFTATATLAPGESRVATMARLMMELAEFAASERDKKIAGFLKAYRALKAGVKEDA